MRDLNEDADISSWPVYHEDKMMTGRPYGNSFMPRPAPDGYPQYDKEVLRKTMLIHEATFKDQVAELHRVYRVQRNLMEELRRKEEMNNYSTPLNASTSSFHADSSRMPSDGSRNVWDISGKSSCSRPSFSGLHNMQSPSELIKDSGMQGHIVPNGSLLEHRSFDSDSKKLARKMFDLQLPADKYIDNEEGEHTSERVFALENNVNLSIGNDRNLKCPGDSSNSDLSFRNKPNLADLNYPIPVEEVASSSSVGNFLGHVACSSDSQVQNTNRQNSISLGLPREFYQSTSRGMLNGTHRYVRDSENTAGRPEYPPFNLENGQSRSALHGISHSFGPVGSPSTSKQTLNEHRSTQLPSFLMDDQRKRGLLRESENCSRELAQRSDRLANRNFLTPVSVPDIPSTHPAVRNVAESGSSSSFGLWNKSTSGLMQGSPAVQPLHCYNTPTQLSTMSEMTLQKNGIIEPQWNLNGHPPLNTGLRGGMSYPNGYSHRSPSKLNASEDRYPSAGFDYRNCNGDSASTSMYFENCGTTKYFKGSECMDVKSAKDLNLNMAITNGFKEGIVPQQDIEILGERRTKVPGLPWLKKNQFCSDGPRRTASEKGLCQSQSYSYQSNPNFGNGKVLAPNSVQDSSSTSIVFDAENHRNQKNESLSGKKILGLPIFDGTHTSENNSSISFNALHSLSEYELPSNGEKPAAVRINSACDTSGLVSCQKLSSDNVAAAKELDKGISNVKHHFNLNFCADEEEPCTYSVSRETRMIDINLEAPALPESLEMIPSEEESQVDPLKISSQSSQVGPEDLSEELVKNVAEAIMIISSAEFCFHSEDVTSRPSERSPSDSLCWFADIVSSHSGSLDGKVGVISKGKGNRDGSGASSSSSDYFETMTLKLTESKADECLCKPWIPEPQNEEDACVSSLVPTRRRRGHAKRGRQRRDFQRDILPGLVSLSRHEVTEDLQVIGGLMRATGHPWQTGVTRRSATRNGWARGRKRTRNVTPAVVEPIVRSPPRQQANNNDLGLEERSLTGWGKTTRRPRRQRFAAGNISIPITQV